MSDLELVLSDLRSVFPETKLPIGTKRTWSTGTVIKTKKGWVPIKDAPAKPKAKDKPKPAKPKSAAKSPGAAYYKGYKAPKPGKPPVVGSLAPVPTGIKWSKPKHEPKSSREKFWGPDGRPTKERRKLHRSIISSFLEGPPPVPKGKRPVGILMMGGPASGKGTLTKTVPEKDFVMIDNDRIKEMIPEYQELVKKGDKAAASYVHEEAAYITSKLGKLARKQRKNVVMDGTGKFAGDYLYKMQSMQKEGYYIQLMMPDLDADEAVKRAKKRGEETGRWVPESVVRQNHAVIPGNFMQLAKAADSAMLFNNRGKKPELVWSQIDGESDDHNTDFMDKFREKWEPKKKRRLDHIEAVRGLSAILAEADADPPSLDAEALMKLAATAKGEEPGERKFKEGEGLVLPEPESLDGGEDKE